MPKLLLVVNEDRFLLSHRTPIALAARKAGIETVIVTKDTGRRGEIEEMGFRVLELPINPTGMDPLEELKTFNYLRNLYKKEKPDIVHHVGLKNILWGGLAAKLTGVKGVVNAVSGLGGLFNGDHLSITARGVLRVMGYSNDRKNVRLIFQNNDDLSLFLKKRAVKPEQIEFTKGSGIDLDAFTYVEEPAEGEITVIFTGRMVREKGVCDLIEAAELIKNEYAGKVRFWLCGRTTTNKTSVTEKYLQEHCDGTYICWLHERKDIKQLLEKSHIMAFPSYYREGVPKSLIEASAIGRPMITCDSTGCCDVVDDGVNGYLVPPRASTELAAALKKLIENKDLRIRMGKAARAKAEKYFSIENVVATHMRIYNDLLK